MARSTWVQIAMLVILLVWGYRLAHPPPESASGAGEEISLWNLTPEEVIQITVNQTRSTVHLFPRGPDADGELQLWVETEVTRSSTANRDQTGGQTEDQTSGEPEPILTAFKGNRSARQAFDALRQPRATRRIGALAELDAAVFGLTEPEGDILVSVVGDVTPLHLVLGGTTYGGANRYVMVPADGEGIGGDHTGDGSAGGTVYLLPDSTLKQFTRPAQRLIEKQLLEFAATDATRAELRLAGKAVSLWRLVRTDPASQEWARNSEASEGEETLQAWIRNLARLRVDAYVDEEDEKTGAGNSEGEASGTGDEVVGEAPDGESALSVILHRPDGPTATLQFLREIDSDWLVRSSFTGHTVRVNGDLARKLIDTANSLFAQR